MGPEAPGSLPSEVCEASQDLEKYWFWMVPVNQPGVLLNAFLERFKSSCFLELQLPAMKPEYLKTMSLTEEVISVLLQLIEEELKKEGRSPAKIMAEPLALCEMLDQERAVRPTLNSLHLPVLTCSYCQRKAGLWSFQQIEGMAACDAENSFNAPSTPVSGPLEVRGGERTTPSSPTPCRMKLRSQDTSRADQTESTPSPVVRTRSRDSPSPSEDLHSPLQRGKRPMTRSRGQVGQHRDWCPWVSTGRGGDTFRQTTPTYPQAPPSDSDSPEPGWKASLSLLLSMKKGPTPTGASPSQGLHDKTKRVFKIFRQWQVSSSAQ
ncbi:hypothetical protein JZ751_005803 [Albula glossodonta]|uniref:NuBaID C-terminal domain-containing protein n=1 Tax=Albula glossodonta TaxID=121402 RepID=A0A8T2P5B5_9TELE|nr:hypothetical protein JZ751_005803 [Albula glossodonta]